MGEDGAEIFIGKTKKIQTELPQKEIPALPFTYVRTYDRDSTQYHPWRVNPVRFGGKENKPRTDEEILEEVRKDREDRDWFTYEYWRDKGIPEEQIEFQINDQQITVYNWNKDISFTDEHVQRAQKVFQEFAARFPQILDQIRWVLIDDKSQTSAFGDPDKYPLNGFAMRQWRAFRLLPRGMELIPHRIAKASNFEGTFAHESTHLIQSEFEAEWSERFKWGWCDDNPDEYEVRPTPDGTAKKFFNKTTGEMAPQGQFPLQPDQCITYYAKQNMGEDIADSMVGYIYDPDLLNAVSSEKYSILQGHDAKKPKPDAVAKRIPKDEIRLPEVKPETVYYYIDEPK